MKTRIFFILLLIGSNSYAIDSEKIFDKAKRYTVKIYASIQMPFIGETKSASMGTGFIIDAKRRWAMTNAHVVGRSPSLIKISTIDTEYAPAKKIYVDPYLDLAIVQLSEKQSKNLGQAKLHCDKPPGTGHPVVAYGHPHHLSYTGTRGIISGKTKTTLLEKLQTDTPVNPGNSGGPLISLNTGKVVAVVSSRIADENDQNTNFSIPMKYGCKIVKLLQQGKNPSPPDIPIIFFQSEDEIKKLVVAQYYPTNNSPPLQNGDEILNVIGYPDDVRTEGDFIHALRGNLPFVKLSIRRKEKVMTVKGEMVMMSYIISRKGIYFSGLNISKVVYRDRSSFGHNNMLMIHDVEAGTPAEANNFEGGQIIESVNNQEIRTLHELHKILVQAQKDNKKTTFILKNISDHYKYMFDYFSKTVTVNNLKYVGDNVKDVSN